MRYRPHKGSLADAMKEMVEIRDFHGLLWHLQKTHPPYCPPFDPGSITIEPYSGADDRIGWEKTYIVLQDGCGIGFTDEPS